MFLKREEVKYDATILEYYEAAQRMVKKLHVLMWKDHQVLKKQANKTTHKTIHLVWSQLFSEACTYISICKCTWGLKNDQIVTAVHLWRGEYEIQDRGREDDHIFSVIVMNHFNLNSHIFLIVVILRILKKTRETFRQISICCTPSQNYTRTSEKNFFKGHRTTRTKKKETTAATSWKLDEW